MAELRGMGNRFVCIEYQMDEADDGRTGNSSLSQKLKERVAQWKELAMKLKSFLESENIKFISQYVEDMEGVDQRAEIALAGSPGFKKPMR